MLVKRGQELHWKLVAFQERLMKAGVPTTEQSLGMKRLRQLFNKVSMGASINIASDPSCHIPGTVKTACIDIQYRDIDMWFYIVEFLAE